MVHLHTTQGLNFKMEITPNRGTSGRWRLDLKTKIFGNNPAPTIERVEIEKI